MGTLGWPAGKPGAASNVEAGRVGAYGESRIGFIIIQPLAARAGTLVLIVPRLLNRPVALDLTVIVAVGSMIRSGAVRGDRGPIMMR